MNNFLARRAPNLSVRALQSQYRDQPQARTAPQLDGNRRQSARAGFTKQDSSKIFSSPYARSTGTVIDERLGPIKFSVLDPVSAHLSFYKNPAIGLKVFEQKRRARLANISRLYPSLSGVAATKLNLPAVPAFATGYVPNEVYAATKSFVHNGSKPVAVAQGLEPMNTKFAPSDSDPSYSFFQPRTDGGVGGSVVYNDISRHGSTDPVLTEAFKLEGSPISTLFHELAHYSAYSPTVFSDHRMIPVASPDDGVIYTSRRRGYGNAVAEAQGGMHRLSAWFANKFGYVPKTFGEAVTTLQSLGYLEPDENSPHGAMRFSYKFATPDINGFSTTLDDQLANYAYAHNGHIGPYKANIKPDRRLKTYQDRKYILDRQNEMWNL